MANLCGCFGALEIERIGALGGVRGSDLRKRSADFLCWNAAQCSHHRTHQPRFRLLFQRPLESCALYFWRSHLAQSDCVVAGFGGGKKKEENVGFFIVYSKDRLLFSGV